MILRANSMVPRAVGGPVRIFSDSPAAAIRARVTAGSSRNFGRAGGRTRFAFLPGGLGRPGLRGIWRVSHAGGDGLLRRARFYPNRCHWGLPGRSTRQASFGEAIVLIATTNGASASTFRLGAEGRGRCTRRRVSESAELRVNARNTGSRVGVAYPASGYRCLACRSRRVQYRAANRRVA
jgi:hypothetical protein